MREEGRCSRKLFALDDNCRAVIQAMQNRKRAVNLLNHPFKNRNGNEYLFNVGYDPAILLPASIRIIACNRFGFTIAYS